MKSLKSSNKFNPLLAIVILIGVVWALYLNVVRHEIEQRNNTVEMAMEYEGLLKLAALEGQPADKVLLQFKDAGINSLMIFDTTLERLSKKGDLFVTTSEELKKVRVLGAEQGLFASVPAQELLASAAFITPAQDVELFNDVVADLRLRYGAERVLEVGTSPRIVKVLGSTQLVPEDKYDEPLGVLQAPLGLPAKDLRHVASLGFNVIVRPQNYINVNEQKIDSIFARLQKAGVTAYAYMPCGKEVVGYPGKLEYMGQKLQENKMQLVMLEHYTQLRFANIEGLVPLSEFTNYNAARSYVIDGLEQKKIGVAAAVHRWAITDEERNIRVNYIRPFMLPVEGKSSLDVSLQYVRDVKKSVEARGYTIGQAGVFSTTAEGYASYFPAKWKFLPVTLAILAGVVLFASLLFPVNGKQQVLVWLVLSVCACAVLFMGRGLLSRQLLALTAGSVFPVLSMHIIFNIWDKYRTQGLGLVSILVHATWQLALAVALSLCGAALLSAILTDSRFLLEIDIYRGVKLTFMLPVLFTALLFAKRYDLLSSAGKGVQVLLARINALLSGSLTLKHLAIMLVVLVILLYFVGRSGHTGGVPVPAIELKMRAFLEQVMYARPREKEFMVGHPAFYLAVMAAYKGAPKLWQFALACAAVIGQGSLVQTFCHMRTPVVMSFVRALDGYAVGVLFGVVGVVGATVLLYIWKKLQRRYLEQ